MFVNFKISREFAMGFLFLDNSKHARSFALQCRFAAVKVEKFQFALHNLHWAIPPVSCTIIHELILACGHAKGVAMHSCLVHFEGHPLPCAAAAWSLSASLHHHWCHQYCTRASGVNAKTAGADKHFCGLVPPSLWPRSYSHSESKPNTAVMTRTWWEMV